VTLRARRSELIHDMRNRLAIARANIEAFIDGKLSPTPARLKAVLQSLAQLDALLDDVKSAEVTGPKGVHPVEIDVCEVLNREYRAVEALAAEKNIRFSIFRCPAKLAACSRFIGDPVRIGQIVSNVLLNAVRYTPAGGEIRVDCTHQADQLQISIADSGPGVPSEERERIFEQGVRGGAGAGKPGSGLGLAIAKEYVEAQGGTIEVSPSTGHGAQFVVRLPGTVFANTANAGRCDICASGPQPSP
jgi:two-component system, OmpR family, sensor histidine kinase BaeS